MRAETRRVKLCMDIIPRNKNNCQSLSRVKIYPDILIAAARGQNGGAAKLWTLAKHFDQPGGYGNISSDNFRHWVIDILKWKPGTYDRYINQAQILGIIERRGDMLRLAGAKHAALAVGCNHLGDVQQAIRLKQFAGKHWLAFTYAAFMRRYNGQTISAKTISELTGIPIRTIYYYDKLLGKGIKKRRNYAILKAPPDPQTIADCVFKKYWHVFNGFGNLQGKLIKAIASQRFIYAKLASQPKHMNDKGKLVNTKNGQRKRINNELNAALSESSISGGSKVQRVRLYIEDASTKARNETERKLRRLDNKRGSNAPELRYKFKFKQYGTGFYDAI